jgi:hypothetical protein
MDQPLDKYLTQQFYDNTVVASSEQMLLLELDLLNHHWARKPLEQ